MTQQTNHGADARLAFEPSVSRFLSVLYAHWPADGKRHHLTLGPAGLELGLWVDGGLRMFSVEDREIADPEKTAADIAALLHG